MAKPVLILALAVAMGFATAGSASADENVRAVQEQLRDGGFYSGEIDGAYSTELAAALTRYQTHNGLPISGQLDVETSNALGAKPAVGPSTDATGQSSETWRRLRKGERRSVRNAQRSETAATEPRETSSRRTDEAAETNTETVNEPREKTVTTTPVAQSRNSSLTTQEAPPPNALVASESGKPASTPPATTQTSSETAEPASKPPAIATSGELSMERLRDFVAAFVLAGLDRNVGAETEFFADRVEYYDSGVMDREKIRQDLKRYDEQWPERHFWIAGKITLEPQSDHRVRVTFPLGFKLRNGNKQSSGKVDKTLVLESAGDDLQIVAVNEVSASKR